MEYYGYEPKIYRLHLLINHDLFEVRIISSYVSENYATGNNYINNINSNNKYSTQVIKEVNL
jgi:hypothetical protein